MDHKVSKDMISSGMIPSGEKTQADLGRTQYGSAPSPSSLMEAYQSIYEHHQKDADGKVIEHDEKEELNEGKMPEGLKNYLMKKGKKKDKEKVEEGMGGMVKAAVKVGKMLGKKVKEVSPKPDTQMNDVDLFDLVKGKLIDEGCDEQEAIKIMVNLSEEDLNELLGKAALVTGGLVAGKMALDAGKKRFDKFLNKQRNQSPIGGNKRVDDTRTNSGDPNVGQKIKYGN